MSTLCELSQQQWQAGQLLLVDKPLQWTSFQVVNKIRWLLKKKLGIKKIKVGHAGTLDPLATGLLLVCVGKWTKKIESFQGMDKVYTGTLLLGATTPSFDLETEVAGHFPTQHIDQALLEAARSRFVGEQLQSAPLYSALKKDGVRLYEYARKGETVAVPKRKIRISKFSLDSSDFPIIHFVVHCSKGTYIRSLAHDFGLAVHSGAHLTALRRTHIGTYDVADAYSLDHLIRLLDDRSTKHQD